MTQRYIGGLIYNPPGGYSGYFNGSSSYLSAPDNAAWYFTGDFTVECWAYWNNTSSSEANVLAQHRPASAANQAINFYSDTTTLYFVYSSSYVSTTIAAGQWYHLAMSCTSGTASCYVNGVRINTFSMPSRIDSADPFTIGARTGSGGSGATGYFPGYISNVRVINGTGIYSGSSITVPTGALQNITNTKLLTCQSATFIDNSSSPFTITNNSATVSIQNPFPLTTLPNPAQGGAGNGIFSMSQYQSLKQQNLWPTVDPYFDYTTLLLHGNGTNGGQNNTFQDSSTNNFTITRNGNTTQGTFSPFSQTGWSNYFDGSGDYLTVPNSSSFAFGTGDFTIEFWFNTSTVLSDKIFLDFRNAGSSNNLVITTGGSSGPAGALRYASGVLDITSGSVSICNNGWNHCAAVRQSGTVRVYVNGVSTATGSDTSNFSSTSGTIQIGRNSYGGNEIEGYVSNLRIVKGTAVYTSNFTPPTAPLTNITNTSLLTCQSNRFIDNGTANSGSGFTLTVNGNTSVQAFSPFAPTAAYSASTVGGSGYFDGSGDYLTTVQSANLAIGTNDFCIEYWVYSLNTNEITPFGQWASGNSDWILQYRTDSPGNQIRFYYNSSNELSGNYTIVPYQWTHVAVCRSGSTMSLYANGTRLATKTDTTSINNGRGLTIGVNPDGPIQQTNGYITDTRIVVGSSVYTPSSSTLTVPTAPLTAISNTKFLCGFTNAAIIDNTAKNVLETVGNAQISTTQSKFGGASIYLDGNDNCVIPNSENFNFRNGNFTIEFWYYPSTLTVANAHILDFGDGLTGGQNGWNVGFFGSSNTNMLGVIWTYDGSSENKIQDSVALTTGSWVFVTVVRSGTSLVLYKNGIAVASATLSGAIATSNRPLVIGSNQSLTSGYVNGYIDDLRITKGIARYTSNFTPQTSQWQDQ